MTCFSHLPLATAQNATRPVTQLEATLSEAVAGRYRVQYQRLAGVPAVVGALARPNSTTTQVELSRTGQRRCVDGAISIAATKVIGEIIRSIHAFAVVTKRLSASVQARITRARQ